MYIMTCVCCTLARILWYYHRGKVPAAAEKLTQSSVITQSYVFQFLETSKTRTNEQKKRTDVRTVKMCRDKHR